MAKSSEITLHVHGKSVHISKYQEGADSLLAASTFCSGSMPWSARYFRRKRLGC